MRPHKRPRWHDDAQARAAIGDDCGGDAPWPIDSEGASSSPPTSSLLYEWSHEVDGYVVDRNAPADAGASDEGHSATDTVWSEPAAAAVDGSRYLIQRDGYVECVSTTPGHCCRTTEWVAVPASDPPGSPERATRPVLVTVASSAPQAPVHSACIVTPENPPSWPVDVCKAEFILDTCSTQMDRSDRQLLKKIVTDARWQVPRPTLCQLSSGARNSILQRPHYELQQPYLFLQLASGWTVEQICYILQELSRQQPRDDHHGLLEFVAVGVKLQTAITYWQLQVAVEDLPPAVRQLQLDGDQKSRQQVDLSVYSNVVTAGVTLPVGSAANKRQFQRVLALVGLVTQRCLQFCASAVPTWVQPGVRPVVFFEREPQHAPPPHLVTTSVSMIQWSAGCPGLNIDASAWSLKQWQEQQKSDLLLALLRLLQPSPSSVTPSATHRLRWTGHFEEACVCYTQVLHRGSHRVEYRLEPNDTILMQCLQASCQHQVQMLDYLYPLRDQVDWGPFTVTDVAYDSQGYMQPLTLDTRVTVLIAPMGSGKTHVAVQTVAAELQRHAREQPPEIPFTSVLPTHRIQQAYSTKARFRALEYAHYLDPVNADGLPPTAQPRVIVQYESCYKIAGGRKNLVVVDEIRSVLSNMFSMETNKQHLLENYQAFNCLATNADHLLLMDADVEADGLVAAYVRQHFAHAPHEVRILRYPNLPSQKRRVVIQPHFLTWLQLLIAALRSGHRIGLILRTRRQGQQIEQVLQRQLQTLCAGKGQVDDRAVGADPEFSHLFYHSEADQNMMKDFEDINTAWASVSLVMLTSKVTVGADCQQPFHQVFAHLLHAGGCAPRTCFQMLARFRQVAKSDICTCIRLDQVRPDLRHNEVVGELHTHCEASKAMILQHYAEARQRLPTAPDEGTNLQDTPQPYLALAAYHYRESHSSFNRLFLHQCRRLDWAVVLDERAPPASATPALLAALADLPDRQAQWYDELVVKGGLVNGGHIFERERMENRASERELFVNTVAACHFPFRRQKLTYQELRIVKTHRLQIQHLALLMRRSEGFLQAQLVFLRMQQPMNDLHKGNSFMSVIEMMRLCSQLGVDNLQALETATVTQATLTAHETVVQAACVRSRTGRSFQQQPRASTAATPWKRTLHTLNVELQALFGMRLKFGPDAQEGTFTSSLWSLAQAYWLAS